MLRSIVIALALIVTAALAAPAFGADADAVIATVAVPGQPFASVSTHDGRVLFVSVSGAEGGVVVFRVVPKGLARIGFVPVRTHSALGMSLLADDSVLLVADGNGVALIDAAAAAKGERTDAVYVDDGVSAGTTRSARGAGRSYRVCNGRAPCDRERASHAAPARRSAGRRSHGTHRRRPCARRHGAFA